MRLCEDERRLYWQGGLSTRPIALTSASSGLAAADSKCRQRALLRRVLGRRWDGGPLLLHPQDLARLDTASELRWQVQDSNLRRHKPTIYSPHGAGPGLPGAAVKIR